MSDRELARVAREILERARALVEGDGALDRLSREVTALRDEAYADGELDAAERDRLRARLSWAQAELERIAAARGYPAGHKRPATADSFRLYQEQQELHFEWMAGRDLRGGALGDLKTALARGDGASAEKLTARIGLDIATSPSAALGHDKVRLLRANLSLVEARGAQKRVLAAVREALETAPSVAGPPPVLTPAQFDEVSTFHTPVAVAPTPLPAEVAGSNRPLPNRPIAGWEAITRSATGACLDRLERRGALFTEWLPAGESPATVAVKLDLNFGADGAPTVSDPTTTAATLTELLERAARRGAALRFTVGDSCGAENTPLGRTTSEILRDTGNYHYALKAGLSWAASRSRAGAAEALRKVLDAEGRGVFFGSKDDARSSPADLQSVEDAAREIVTVVDYDCAGYTEIDPQLGPMGLASWGTRAFRIARPWVEADYRVHVARGLSTHVMAGWTGSVKGLIGLHAFGLRPADQGNDKRGDNLIDALPLATQLSGFLAIFQKRSGFIDLAARALALRDDRLSATLRAAEAKWEGLSQSMEAWALFTSEVRTLAVELKRDQQAGMAQVELMDKMRGRTRASLDRADRLRPGFRQALWDAAAEATRFAEVAGYRLRHLLPGEMRDDKMGLRIGLLTQLPFQSDLVVKAQPKFGEGGGPDAYATVRDVGVLIVGTNEAATDVVAWREAGRTDNPWAANAPLWANLAFGRGPMHLEEIEMLR